MNATNLEISLAGNLGTADELLTQALEKLRETVICDIEGACILVRSVGEDGETFVPEPGTVDVDGRIDIEGQIDLIRAIELHLGAVPFIGPEWFDDMVAKRGAWEGGVR